jgi:tetratricopeptide (TPR) repeat protein
MRSNQEMTTSSVIPANARDTRTGSTTVVWLCLFVVVLGAAIYFRLASQDVATRGPDERVYMAYATEVAQFGVGAVPALVDDYNRSREQWIYPPPVRIGYIFLVAEIMKLSGASAEKAAVSVSFAFSLLGFFVTALLGLRFFDRWAVLIASALLSVSPLDLVLARRVWQDSVVAGIGILLFYLCVEASMSSRPQWWRVCFWIVASYFLLIKELALVIYALCALWLVIDVSRRGFSWKAIASVSITCGLVVIVSYGAVMWISGGARLVLQVYQHMEQALSWNQYNHLYQRGPWYSFPLGLWVLSPVTTLLCGLGIGQVILRGKSFTQVLGLDPRQSRVAWALALFVVVVLTAATLPQDFKCLRFVAVIQGPLYLIDGLLIRYLLIAGRSRLAPAAWYVAVCAVAASVALVCLTDHARFRRIFVQYQLDDLAIVRVVNYAFAAGSHQAKVPTETVVRQDTPPDKDAGSQIGSSSEYLLSRSLGLYNQGLYSEAIAAAREALRLRPNYAEAWNNIGAAYNQLARYREAEAACEQALRFKPDFDLARNNLQYARERAKPSGK